MGWFDRWRKAKRQANISREVLFEVANGSDTTALDRLCSDHSEWILGNFKSWTKVPPEVRGDRRALDLYANSLIAIAQLFASRGHPELLQMMMPNDERNPLAQWPAKLSRARDLLASGDVVQARSLAKEVIADIEACTGPGADEYLPKAWGILGEIHFRAKELDDARDANERALELCRRSADVEGVAAYCANLGEIARIRGDVVATTSWFQEAIGVLESNGLSDKAEELRSRLPPQRRLLS